MSALTIPDSHRDLVTSTTVALSMINDDGSIQTTAVWVLLDDDGVLRTSLAKNRKKYLNLLARPQATVFAIAADNPFHTLEVRATVEIEDEYPDDIGIDQTLHPTVRFIERASRSLALPEVSEYVNDLPALTIPFNGRLADFDGNRPSISVTRNPLVEQASRACPTVVVFQPCRIGNKFGERPPACFVR